MFQTGAFLSWFQTQLTPDDSVWADHHLAQPTASSYTWADMIPTQILAEVVESIDECSINEH